MLCSIHKKADLFISILLILKVDRIITWQHASFRAWASHYQLRCSFVATLAQEEVLVVELEHHVITVWVVLAWLGKVGSFVEPGIGTHPSFVRMLSFPAVP